LQLSGVVDTVATNTVVESEAQVEVEAGSVVEEDSDSAAQVKGCLGHWCHNQNQSLRKRFHHEELQHGTHPGITLLTMQLIDVQVTYRPRRIHFCYQGMIPIIVSM